MHATPSEQSLTMDLFGTDLPPGITYVPDYIRAETEAALIARIELGPWDTTYARRRKHYGKLYNAARPDSLQSNVALPIPRWLEQLFEKLVADAHLPKLPRHALVNEYLPGQGIADHIDRASKPGGTVASLSLGSSAVMRFTEPQGRRHEVLLAPRSLILLTGPARDTWTHGIPARHSDRIAGQTLARRRRLSITMRTGP